MKKEKNINAFYTRSFIRFYQAYNKTIAKTALENNRFISPPFKLERTTWIKPSFFWMMYRSSWAAKKNQEYVLAIDITHEGFEWALRNSRLSHFDSGICKTHEEWEIEKTKAPVIIQWDPERDMFLNKLDYRSIQVGLTHSSAKLYVDNWIINITDITETVRKMKTLIDNQQLVEVAHFLPLESIYPVSDEIRTKLGMNKKLR